MAIPLPSREEYISRFLSRIKKSGECWEWKGHLNNKGYGMFFCGGRGKWTLAHRFAYEIDNGEGSARDQFVLHSCDNPKCCRPSHLHLGDQAKNMGDAAARRRTASGVRNGNAKLTQENVTEIRRLLNKGVFQKDIAAQFGVTQSAISLIRCGKKWGASLASC